MGNHDEVSIVSKILPTSFVLLLMLWLSGCSTVQGPQYAHLGPKQDVNLAVNKACGANFEITELGLVSQDGTKIIRFICK